MSSAQQSKRRFWQIHLSTAVFLMGAAGALTWRYSFPLCDIELEGLRGEAGQYFGKVQFGWPRWVYRTRGQFFTDGQIQQWEKSSAESSGLTDKIRSDPNYVTGVGLVYREPDPAFRELSKMGVVIDSVVALAILASIAVVSEFIIRRRDRQPPPA